MSSSSPIWSQEAAAMLADLQAHLPPDQVSRLRHRLEGWQRQQTRRTSTPTKTTASAALPILVMRPRALPQTLDPFYFTLQPPQHL